MLYLYNMKELVYFIKHKNIDAIKIGKSELDSFDARVCAFKNASPYGVEVLGVIKVEDGLALEKKLHKRFADKRLNGEWFYITKEDVKHMMLLYGDKHLVNAMNDFIMNHSDVKKRVKKKELNEYEKDIFINKIKDLKKGTILNLNSLTLLCDGKISMKEVREICESMGYVYKTYNVRGEYFRGFKF